MPGTAAIVAAGIGAAGALGGGAIGASGSKSAAGQQSKAAEQAAMLQYQMYQQTVARLAPWTASGTAANTQLAGLLGLPGYSAAGGMGTGSLVKPFDPTMDQLRQTPGYQFTLQQGLQATQNQASALGQGGGVLPGGGLAVSGPEGKGLSQFAEGLASTTYQQQFNNYWAQLNNIYNMLSGASAQGANAAALTGQSGQAAATAAGNALQGGAAASAAGTVGAANALGGAVGSAGNAYTNALLLQSLLPKSGSSTAFQPSATGTYGGQPVYTGPTNVGAPTSYNF